MSHERIKQRGGCRLAICAGNTHKGEVPAWIAPPCRGDKAERRGCVGYEDVAHLGLDFLRESTAHHSGGAARNHIGDEAMGIDIHSTHCHKQIPLLNGTGVGLHAGNGDTAIAHNLYHIYVFNQRIDSHCNSDFKFSNIR